MEIKQHSPKHLIGQIRNKKREIKRYLEANKTKTQILKLMGCKRNGSNREFYCDKLRRKVKFSSKQL